MKAQERLRGFEYLYFIPIFLGTITLSFTALISFAIYVIVYFISSFFPNYGNFLTISDVLLDEEFVDNNPQNSLSVSLTLQGNISLDELRSIFTKNVLNTHSKVNPKKLRYPKLKQYLTTFICFRIWKNDPNFLIKNHIVEKMWDGNDLGNIHQYCLDKPFKKDKSPWELILIRNVNNEDDSAAVSTSFLFLRIHHVMGDGKSLIKLIVECLGNKSIKTAIAQHIRETRWDFLRFLLCFPLNYISEVTKIIRLAHTSFDHPWKRRISIEKTTCKTVVAFTPKILLSNLKQVSKQNGVSVSAVLMSIIAGAIIKVCGENWDKKVIIGYPSPRPNHPESLTNFACGTVLDLPTNQQCELKRLQNCNDELVRMRDKQTGSYLFLISWLTGIQIYPINRMFFNTFLPIGISNNAGDTEGFSLGNTRCVDFRASPGLLRGAAGVGFCTLSYKDEMTISVIAKEATLPKEGVERLAKHIESELEYLLETTKNNIQLYQDSF